MIMQKIGAIIQARMGKVIYGSDYPEVDVIKNLEYVKGKAFEMMRYPEKLFSGNFLKIINT